MVTLSPDSCVIPFCRRISLANFSWRELVAAGVHFGHRTSRWHPRMKPYIFGRRSQIHIVDLKETVKGLLRAQRFLANVAARGDDVLLVGTKRQARRAVQEEAQRCGMPYVSERWLGGMLTNFRTVLSRLSRLAELERMETEGTWEALSKKELSSLRRELRKVRRNLGGVRSMKTLPGALVVVDPHHERIAVREAAKLAIPVVGLTDTDSNPDRVDIVIPGNDDALRSVSLITKLLADAVAEGVARRRAPVHREGRPRRPAPRPKPAPRGARGAEEERVAKTAPSKPEVTPPAEESAAEKVPASSGDANEPPASSPDASASAV